MSVGIKWNHDQFEALRRRADVAGLIDSKAAKIAAELGEGYEHSPYEGRSRHRASVMAVSKKAQVENRKHNTLIKALTGKKER